MTRADRFPGIKRAALEIAYDNCGINITRIERRMLSEFWRWLDRQPGELLPAIDAWLAALSSDNLQTVCAGDQDEARVILQSAPPFTEKLLNDYFEEVC